MHYFAFAVDSFSFHTVLEPETTDSFPLHTILRSVIFAFSSSILVPSLLCLDAISACFGRTIVFCFTLSFFLTFLLVDTSAVVDAAHNFQSYLLSE